MALRIYTEEQKERKRECSRKHYVENKEKVGARMKAYHKANKEKISARGKISHLKGKYGLTPEGYTEMYDAQEGKCWICKTPRKSQLEAGTSAREVLCIDHCHESGKIRGLLCSICNQAIGSFQEDEQNLLNALTYIRHFKGLEALALEQIDSDTDYST